MIKKTLIKYLKKFTAYNSQYYEASTLFIYTTSFTHKHELIKRIKHPNSKSRFQYHEYIWDDNMNLKTFQRYMNNSKWKF